jgi:prepilin-type N-terminal cleavage/methylation domain-containing protein
MKNSRGFTLIETIVAISILSVGIVIIYGVFYNMYIEASSRNHSLKATYLAQEGVEVVRNMRDNNWISQAGDWKQGIDSGNCNDGCYFEADYKTGVGAGLSPNVGRLLNVDGQGIYSYDESGDNAPTIFKRKITITGSNDLFGSSDVFRVDSTVSWQNSGKEFLINIVEFLYNWY